MATNPRWKSGRRRLYQQRFKAMGLPCAICGKPIDYSLPYYVTDEEGRKHINMMAFVIDEKIPVSKWWQGGYNSAAECADDFENLSPCHAICNQLKGNKMNFKMNVPAQRPGGERKGIDLDGEW